MKLNSLKTLQVNFLNIPEGVNLVDDHIRRKVMLYLLIIPSFFSVLALGIFALIEGEIVLAILDFVIGFIIVICFFIARKKNAVNRLIIFLYSLSMILFLTLFTLGLARHQSFVWYYIIPIESMFLFGRKKGVFLTLLIMFISILIAVFGEFIPFYSPYPDGFLVRIFSSYLFVTVCTYLMESTRYQTKKELEKTLNQLHNQAICDGLTGLNNRRYMDDILKFVLRQKKPDETIAFIMADLDYFKQYNDTYGHQAGDRVLQKFAAVLKAQTQRNTDYAFRYGGEEFSLILSFTTKETAEKYVTDIIRATQALNIPHITSHHGKVTVSIGAAISGSKEYITEDDMLRVSDEALYTAKSKGRNCYRIENIN